MNLFGRKKQIQVPTPNETITKLHDTIALFSKREAHLDKQIAKTKQEAVLAYKNKKKTRAIHLLTQTKSLEKQLNSLFGMRANVETQLLALSQAVFNEEAVKAIGLSKDVLKSLETKIDPDKVADMMDDVGDAMVNLSDITDALARPITHPDVDDETLLRELEEELAETELFSVPDLPVPNHPITIQSSAQTREEKERKDEETLKQILA